MKDHSKTVVQVASLIVLVAFFVGIGWSFYSITQKGLTSRENAFLSLILTIFSILATWLVSHFYSEFQRRKAVEEVQDLSQANLLTYARKAAEKVNNLSNELNRLAIYLRQELDDQDYESPEKALRSREERLESAVHIIATLKSVNDTALSDWRGVIGDELEQQQEEQLEREEQLRELITMMETLVQGQQQNFAGGLETTDAIRSELASIKVDFHRVLSQLAGTALPKRAPRKPTSHPVEIVCPACAETLRYRQRARDNSIKGVKCPHCDQKLVSLYTQGSGFRLELREMKEEQLTCPKCSGDVIILLDNFRGSTGQTQCRSCGLPVRAHRATEGIRVLGSVPIQKPQGDPRLTEEIIQKVREQLPEQPWPTGTHRKIAESLHLPANLVTKAVQKLIRRGECYIQIEGKVYVPRDKATHEADA